MAFCSKCGVELASSTGFCPACGAATPGAQPVGSESNDVASNRAMGILAYIGILVLVPIFAAKESKFARYHANQGLVLVIMEAAYGILMSILNAIFYVISWRLGVIMGTLMGLLWFAFVALVVIGIINASKGETKPLPVIGSITILK